MASLAKQQHPLARSEAQINFLEKDCFIGPSFKEKLAEQGLFPLKPTEIEIFQMNLGKMCNQTCRHCHVDAGPDRKEIMTQETMLQCLDQIKSHGLKVVDLTGGAPEMNPYFRWLVEELSSLGVHIIVRCNLTIILANPKFHDLPQFFKTNNIEVISSLPHFTAVRTNAQRGSQVFEKSIQALKLLNKVGYGREPTYLLNLVYNPSGAFLPGDQLALEKEFKTRLKSTYDVDFNQLFTITNLPISRYLDYLQQSGNYEAYMENLIATYNPTAAKNVMCRNTLSIGWDGYLYDCDFNQMLDMKIVTNNSGTHISNIDFKSLQSRNIRIGQHCFGCTAGAGSSCGGATT